MPKGLSLSANLWRQRQGGIQFHERLIITDVAGVLLDPGLDEGKPGEKYDITLLPNSECPQYLKRFDKLSPAYDLVDFIEISGTS